ncbi:MAG: transglycosylase domain-containing protein [Candidatus Nanopelagicales bacterium]
MASLGAILGVSVLAGTLVGLMLIPFAGSLGVLTRDVVRDFESLPDELNTPPLPERSVILAADGSVLATIYYQNRIEVPLDSIAPIMRQATIAVEDARFLEHNGVDFRGIVRAAASNASSGEISEGASTLTMQYIKNVLVNQATSAEELDAARGDSSARKIKEVRLALALEKRFTKSEILSRYLNIAYFGSGAYGIEAASRRYFSKPASNLTLAEAATLAGIVQRPTSYDPIRNPELSAERRNVVLGRMANLGYVSQADANRAMKIPMKSLLNPTQVSNGCTSSYAPFFCDYVLQSIRENDVFGETPEERETFLRRGGYTITTTLDPTVQKSVTEIVNSTIPIDDPSGKAAAISMVQPGTGHIIAMTQNREWGTSGKGRTTYNYNAPQSMGGTIGMQAGSTFKVFTLAAALEAGISPNEYISSPSPNTFNNFRNCETGMPYDPVTVRNSTTSGTLNMAQATAYSTNTYFMAIEERTGICRPVDIAESLGVTLGNGDPLLRVPSFTLGTMEIAPLSLANAYATFAAHGRYCEPVPILEIRDRDGAKLNVPNGDCRQVLDRSVADGVTVMLNGVVDGNIPGRTGAPMNLGDRPVAGKTGTTNESAAVWFAGFTPQVASAVWVGDPRGGYAFPLKDVTINGNYYRQVYGGTIPGPIWKESMLAASADLPIANFDLRTEFTVAPDLPPEPEPGPFEEIFIPEGETTFDNSDPNSLEVPELVPAPVEDEVFENPAPAADPVDNLVP